MQVTSDRMRGNGLNLLWGRFRLDIGKNCFTERIVKHWDRLEEGEVGQSTIPGVISKMYRHDAWGHGSVVDVVVLG